MCLYQGDELGLPEARIPEDIPVDKIQDPFGKALYPEVKGQRWFANSYALAKIMPKMLVLVLLTTTLAAYSRSSFKFALLMSKVNNPRSLLNTWRRMLHWQKQQPALTTREGYEILDTDEPILGFIRESEEQRLLCLFNLSQNAVDYQLPPECKNTTGSGFNVDRQDDTVKIPGYGAYFGVLIQD